MSENQTQTARPNWVFFPLGMTIAMLITGALCLLLALDHKRKPDPKPTPLRSTKTVWLTCNAGMDVTDLRDCPEYHTHLDRKGNHD